MTIQLHAQPYDITATGFSFKSAEDYAEKAAKLRNAYGDPVEEFEIQFIDGEAIDAALAKSIGLSQANLAQFFACAEDWDDHQKRAVIIAVGECGYSFENSTQPDDFDLDTYEVDSLQDLAEQFVEDGLLGDIPERLAFYIDYEAIARDLSVDYSETKITGTRLIYRCG